MKYISYTDIFTTAIRFKYSILLHIYDLISRLLINSFDNIAHKIISKLITYLPKFITFMLTVQVFSQGCKFYPSVNLPDKMEAKLRKAVSSSKIILALQANNSGVSENIRF